jgi:acyl-coenzyme A synthetase/AMP-(fatty) acid ligase
MIRYTDFSFSLLCGKINSGVILIEAIPKSAAGKILRRELQALARKESVKTNVSSRL